MMLMCSLDNTLLKVLMLMAGLFYAHKVFDEMLVSNFLTNLIAFVVPLRSLVVLEHQVNYQRHMFNCCFFLNVSNLEVSKFNVTTW